MAHTNDRQLEPSQLPENVAWRYMLRGDYAKALSVYQHMLPDCDKPGPWESFGACLLVSGNASAALDAFLHARALPSAGGLPKGQRYYLMVGVGFWCQGLYEEACTDWVQEMSGSKPAIIEAPALLWWASVKAGLDKYTDLAMTRLQHIWERRVYQEVEWPDGIAAYILGKISAEAFLVQALEGTALSDARQNIAVAGKIAQYYFYLSGRALLESGTKHLDYLHRAVKVGDPYAIVEPEYLIARCETRR